MTLTTEYKGDALATALRKRVLQAPLRDFICRTHSNVYSITTQNGTFFFVEITRILNYKKYFGRVTQIRFEGRPTMRAPQVFSWPSSAGDDLLIQSMEIKEKSFLEQVSGLLRSLKRVL